MKRIGRAMPFSTLVFGLFAMLTLVCCKRDPNKPVKGYKCETWSGVCTCNRSASATEAGNCGPFECCYQWQIVGHAHSELACMCSHGDPKTHACPNASENSKRVVTCP